MPGVRDLVWLRPGARICLGASLRSRPGALSSHNSDARPGLRMPTQGMHHRTRGTARIKLAACNLPLSATGRSPSASLCPGRGDSRPPRTACRANKVANSASAFFVSCLSARTAPATFRQLAQAGLSPGERDKRMQQRQLYTSLTSRRP